MSIFFQSILKNSKYIPTKAGAQAGGLGFQKSQARHKGPAWPSFQLQARAGTSLLLPLDDFKISSNHILPPFFCFPISSNFPWSSYDPDDARRVLLNIKHYGLPLPLFFWNSQLILYFVFFPSIFRWLCQGFVWICRILVSLASQSCSISEDSRSLV